ncbi:MAG: amidohydrolase family protein [Proteobacteria bacterium]|nr:amidohydrolase family protein [Pseudomonadota bacterium]
MDAHAQAAANDALTQSDEAWRLGPRIVVYVARRILTMEPDQPEATAVAVSGNRIVAVGGEADVVKALGERPYDIDRRFADKVMVPGFVEHHVHPLLGASTMIADAVIAIEDWELPTRTWPAAADAATYWVALRAAYAANRTAPATFMTWGYHHEFHGPMSRAALDALSPDRPMVVWHRSCHEVFLNSAAIAKYGLTADKVGGQGLASEQVDLDKGHFYEKGLTLVASALLKDIFTPEKMRAGLDLFWRYLQGKGVTTICEPGTQMIRPLHELYGAVLSADAVPFRTYFIPDGRALYDQAKSAGTLDRLVADTDSYLSWGRGKVQWLPRQVKLFSDGAVFSLLMQVKEPYLDGHKGQWIALPDDYRDAVRRYWNRGYQIHTHVNGDAGLDVVLGALEERLAAAPRNDHRFTIVHFAVSTEEQVQRIGRTQAMVSANPYYVTALADRFSEVGLGPERANNMVRLASVLRQRPQVSLHSDMPMAAADPLLLAWAAATRTTASGRVAAPDQRIPMEQALRGVTIDSAFTIRLENEIGSIRPGKIADFTILEDDPLTVAPSAVRSIGIWGVVFDGTVRPIERSAERRRQGAAPSPSRFASRDGATSRSAAAATLTCSPTAGGNILAAPSPCSCHSPSSRAPTACACGGIMVHALADHYAALA